MKKASPLSKAIMVLTLPFTEAGVFILYWNLFKVHSAVHLGTVNFWTALGVDVTASCIVGVLAMALWSSKLFLNKYNIYED